MVEDVLLHLQRAHPPLVVHGERNVVVVVAATPTPVGRTVQGVAGDDASAAERTRLMVEDVAVAAARLHLDGVKVNQRQCAVLQLRRRASLSAAITSLGVNLLGACTCYGQNSADVAKVPRCICLSARLSLLKTDFRLLKSSGVGVPRGGEGKGRKTRIR